MLATFSDNLEWRISAAVYQSDLSVCFVSLNVSVIFTDSSLWYFLIAQVNPAAHSKDENTVQLK